MSEHRRKPPQSQGGRAAGRRGAQPPSSSGRRAVPPQGSRGARGHRSTPHPTGTGDRQYGGRAEARRAAQAAARGGRRRAQAAGAAGVGGRRPRFIDYPRHGKFGLRRWVPSWKLVTGLCLTFFGSLVVLAGVGYAMVVVPDPNKASQQQNNIYYWSDRTVLAKQGKTNRQNVRLDEIAKPMQKAVIAAENATFYKDKGVDPKGIARALFNMATGGEVQGGSTITQQYVKNAMLNQDQTLTRKFKELFISIKVGTTQKKDKILEGYLNTAWYGRDVYGIQAAAQSYFGKDAADLEVDEAAFLAALLKNGNLYDPHGGIGAAATKEKNTQRITQRWNDVLDLMVKNGDLSLQERARYTHLPKSKPKRESAGLSGQRGYLVELAKKFVLNNPETGVDAKSLGLGGYEIYTTFDRKKTEEMEKAVKGILDDALDTKAREEDKYVQVGGASVEPDTGAIVAIYGGEDYLKHFTNNADYTGAQVGSTFKPFVLAAAMRDGVKDPSGPKEQDESQRTPISWKSLYNGDNKLPVREYNGEIWRDKDGKEWRQRNDGNESYDYINLREAMRVSANTPYIQLGMNVGLKQVKDAAIDAGLRDDESMAGLTPTFSLGTSSPSAIRMAGAYGTFANSGEQVDPYSVKRLEHGNREIYKHEIQKEQAFDEDVANNVTDVLTTVVQEGTGTAAKALNRPAAGKTGTTDQNKSAWFVGYTPQLSTAIGMFRKDDKDPNGGFLSMNGVGGQQSIHGASYPAEIWTAYMKEAMKGLPTVSFPEAEPIGEEVDQQGAPQPTPTVTETTEPTPTPTPTETETQPPTPTAPSPTPTETCEDFFGNCDPGGQNGGNGNPNGGGDGGPTTEPSTSPSGNGGIFGGP